MTRAEHIAWCKERAAEYLERNDAKGAMASFVSDMRKHEGTRNHPAMPMGARLLMAGALDTVADVKTWIEGFN